MLPRNLSAGPLVVRSLALALALVAAHAQDRPNGFYLTSPLSLSAGYDQGFLVGSRATNDSVTLLTAPTFDWMRTTHRTDFSFNYQPEFEIFSRNPDLNAWNHSSALRYRYRINARWGVDAGNLLLSTSDSSRSLSNSLLLLPRGRFLQNSSYAGLSYRADELTKVSFRFDNALTLTDLPGKLAGRLDGVTTAGTVTVDRTLTSHHKLTGSYSFLHSHPLTPEVSGAPTNVHLMNAGYTYEINPALILQLAGGAVKGTQTSFIGAAVVEKRLGQMWLAAGYQRYLSFFGGLAALSTAPPGAFADGLTPNSVYQVFSVRAWGQLSKRLAAEGSAQRAINAADPRFPSTRSVIAQMHLSYKMTDRVAWFIRVEHYGQNANAFLDTTLARNRFFGGLEITLSRAPEPDNPRNRHGKVPQDSDELKIPPPEEN
jgi:hypothetical protein